MSDETPLPGALDGIRVVELCDERGAWAFREFQQDMLGLQARLDSTTPAPWRIEPRRLKANINA